MHNTHGGRPHGRRARPQRRRRRLAVGSAGAARTGPPTKPTRHATGTTDAPTGEHSAVRGMNIHDAPAKCDTTLPMRCRGGRQERAPQPRSRHPHKVSLRAKVRPPNTGSYGISVFLQSWVPRAGVRAIFILLWQCRVGQVRTRGMETITGPCLVSRSDLGKYLNLQTTADTNRRPNAWKCLRKPPLAHPTAIAC